MSRNRQKSSSTKMIVQAEAPKCAAVGVGTVSAQNAAASEYGTNSNTIFDGGDNIVPRTVSVGGRTFEYIPFGEDDMLPYELIDKVGSNLVLAQNQLFNMLSCYGQGIRFFDKESGEKTKNTDIEDFCFSTQLNKQCM